MLLQHTAESQLRESSATGCAKESQPIMKDKIVYIREKIPAFDLPDYTGSRCEVMVPDTLDLQDRASLAVHALTEPTDPEADYEIYMQSSFIHHPPMMQHDFNDHVQAKFLQSLPLMRIVNGTRPEGRDA